MRIEKICPVCGIKFSGRTNQIYCSVSCNQKARRKRYKYYIYNLEDEYDELENKYNELKNKYNELASEYNELAKKSDNYLHKLKKYMRRYGKLKIEDKY